MTFSSKKVLSALLLSLFLVFLWMLTIPITTTQFNSSNKTLPVNGIISQPQQPGSKTTKTGKLVSIAKEQQQTPVSQQTVAQTSTNILAQFKSMQSRKKNTAIKGIPRDRGTTVANPKTQTAIDAILEELGDNATLHVDSLSETLRHLDGDLQKLVASSQTYNDARQKGDFGEMSLALLQEIQPILNIETPADEFHTATIRKDALGMTHVTLEQTFMQIPVWDAELKVHFDESGNPYQISGLYSASPKNITGIKNKITEETANSYAQQAIDMASAGTQPAEINPIIYWDRNHAPELCYQVTLYPNHLHIWNVFVSATDGSIVHRYNNAKTASIQVSAPDLVGDVKTFNAWEEEGEYYAIDTTLPMYNSSSNPPDIYSLRGALYVLDYKHQIYGTEPANDYKTGDINQWDPAVVSLMHFFPLIDEYYRSTFQRNSINNHGLSIEAIVHCQFNDSLTTLTTDNASWLTGHNKIVFGDGDHIAGGKLPYALDVIAHEYTHGVTEYGKTLQYQFQSGALDEALSDFFACMVDRDDWLIGEDVIPLGDFSGKIAMRDLSNPGNPDVLFPNPATMAEYQNLPYESDFGGVHANSGIPSHMMYLLAEGGSYAITKEKAEQIVYRAQNFYLTSRSQFIDFRRAAVSAARDLYGVDGFEILAVHEACDEVGILDEGATPPATPAQVVDGIEQVVFLQADPYAGYDPVRDQYLYRLILNNGTDNYLLAPRYVAGTPPAISGNGEWALYIDATNNIYWTNGHEEEPWTDSGIIRSVSISKNERFIAYTTTNYDNKIHVIDTRTEETYHIELTIPVNSQSDHSLEILFASELTFNFRGDELVFDALTSVPLANNKHLHVWGLYEVHMTDRVCHLALPYRQDTQFEDPVFSHTSDTTLVTDMIFTGEGRRDNDIVVIDIRKKETHTLLEGNPVLAYPSFRGDDESIVFLSKNQAQDHYQIIERHLNEAKTGFIQEPSNLLFSSIEPLLYPTAYRAGEYIAEEAKIVVSNNIDFGEIPVGETTERVLVVSNSGNADLLILSTHFAGEQAELFRHDGYDRELIPPKQFHIVRIQCTPDQPGDILAEIRLRSSDLDNPESVIQLTAKAVRAEPQETATPALTPTAETTAAPNDPTSTPTFTPTARPKPTQTPKPSGMVYEFDKNTFIDNRWDSVPGGFENRVDGESKFITFDSSLFPSSSDQKGLAITVDPGELGFVFARDPFDTHGDPVLVRMTLRSDSPDASIALVALKGDLELQTADGSIAAQIPASAHAYVGQESRMVLVYEPDIHTLFTPAIQVAATGQQGPVTVYIDKLEIRRINNDDLYDINEFTSIPGTNQSAGTDPFVYEFDRASLNENGWNEIPGGFTSREPGNVSLTGFVGNPVPSSFDQKGLAITVEHGQVSFIYGISPIYTGGNPVLLRLPVRADAPDAVITAGLLKNTLEAADGSIAYHAPVHSGNVIRHAGALVLLYQPENADFVTPLIQVASTRQTNVTVLIDRLEVFVLNQDHVYKGSLFNSTDIRETFVFSKQALPTPTTPATGVTPSPTSVAVSSPTPVEEVIVMEQEPNDTLQQPQALGTLLPGEHLKLLANNSAGGINADGVYSGDRDYFSFNIMLRTNLNILLEWDGTADLDYYLYDHEGIVIDHLTDGSNPMRLSGALTKGTYTLLIVSKDEPADYDYRITTQLASEDSNRIIHHRSAGFVWE